MNASRQRGAFGFADRYHLSCVGAGQLALHKLGGYDLAIMVARGNC